MGSPDPVAVNANVVDQYMQVNEWEIQRMDLSSRSQLYLTLGRVHGTPLPALSSRHLTGSRIVFRTPNTEPVTWSHPALAHPYDSACFWILPTSPAKRLGDRGSQGRSSVYKDFRSPVFPWAEGPRTKSQVAFTSGNWSVFSFNSLDTSCKVWQAKTSFSFSHFKPF